ncbi:uncharacterized protein LOC8268763 [Ricinus communis]|uniref:uncharacterized protein LOC8268763 n=1 Tax=Ricinus communis TaxID=3988 RepID=UPI00201A6E53|nr:uncharacterized protein LOC8268763 [Ricinus communis]
MENPSDPKLESSSPQQQPQGKNNPQNDANENISGGSLPPNAMPISRLEVTTPTQFTIDTAPRPSAHIRVRAGTKNGGGVNAGADKGFRKKRGRSLSYDGDVRPKRRADTGLPSTCAVCERKFPTIYALFGHLRMHNKRDWRGAFPPPVYNPDWVENGGSNVDQSLQQPAATQQVEEKEVIPELLDVAQEILKKMQQENISNVTDPIKKLEFDLNLLPQENSSGPSSNMASSQEKIATRFDLNFPPPKEDNDDPPAI